MLVKEVDKIDELEPPVKDELAALEKRWKKLLKWSEERSLRLSKIVSLWSKFREEEIAILNWIDAKDEQLKVADDVNLADEEAVKEQLDIFKVWLHEVKVVYDLRHDSLTTDLETNWIVLICHTKIPKICKEVEVGIVPLVMVTSLLFWQCN